MELLTVAGQRHRHAMAVQLSPIEALGITMNAPLKQHASPAMECMTHPSSHPITNHLCGAGRRGLMWNKSFAWLSGFASSFFFLAFYELGKVLWNLFFECSLLIFCFCFHIALFFFLFLIYIFFFRAKVFYGFCIGYCIFYLFFGVGFTFRAIKNKRSLPNLTKTIIFS